MRHETLARAAFAAFSLTCALGGATAWASTPVLIGLQTFAPPRTLVVGQFANPDLKKCLCVDAPALGTPQACNPVLPSDPTALAQVPFDCLPTPDPVPDESQWMDHLYNAAGQELTGLYNLNAQRCANQAAPDVNCPIQIKAHFQIKCPAPQMQNGACPVAESVAVNYSIRQIVAVPGFLTMKPVVVSDGTTPAATPLPLSQIIALKKTNYSCPPIMATDPSTGQPKQYPQIVQGVDEFGNPKCAIDPSAQSVDAMQSKMCDMEIQQVMTNGGVTTICPPDKATANIRLVNNTHSTADCTNAHGAVFDQTGHQVSITTAATAGGGATVSVNGTPVTSTNISQFNHQYFCLFPGSCPAGYLPFSNWSATSSNICTGTETGSRNILCLPGFCNGHLSVKTLEHTTLANTPIETATYSDGHTDFNVAQGCFCSTLGDQQHTCTANVNQIGCY